VQNLLLHAGKFETAEPFVFHIVAFTIGIFQEILKLRQRTPEWTLLYHNSQQDLTSLRAAIVSILFSSTLLGLIHLPKLLAVRTLRC
jgi:hypothetical protein